MNAIRQVAIAALALAALVVSIGCSGGGAPQGPAASPATASPAAEPAPFPLTLTDTGGHTITLVAPAKRIISHSPGATEILFAIGAGEHVVAADQFSDFPAAAAALPKVKYSDPSPEAELAHQPDFVILVTNQRAQVEPFRALGLPVFFLQEPDSIDGVLENVRLLGQATGRAAEAEALATEMRARIDAVTSRLGDVTQGPTVFYELSDSLYTAAPQTFIGGMLSAVKARNIAEGAVSPFPQLTAEAVIAAAPEVILLPNHEHGGAPEQVRARPGWSAIPAVRDGRLHPIDADVVNRPGPRIVEGIELMARLLYPERFE